MKKMKFSYILVILSVLFLSSCDNEPVDPTVNPNPITPVLPISFKVAFSGQTYSTTQANAVIADGHIKINSFKDSESFTMDLKGTTIGTYLTNTNIATYSSGASQPLYTSINPADAMANTGKVTITSIDAVNKRISGNFDFTGYNNNGTVISTKEFKNGVFVNVPYIIQ